MDMSSDMGSNSTAMTAGGGAFCMPAHMGTTGETMYMDGFRFGLKGDQMCLNLFFSSWTLDTPGKYVGAMVGIFLLAVSIEWLNKLRKDFARHARTESVKLGELWRPEYVAWMTTACHGLQAFLGYLLMLAAMTYSAELFLCVVFGLMAGFRLFYRADTSFLHQETSGKAMEQGLAEETPSSLRYSTVGGPRCH